MTTIKDIQLEIDGEIAIVRLNRPAKRNALSDALVLGDAARGPPQVAEAVSMPQLARGDIEVVLEHQALRRGHRRLGFVHVGALGEREELGDALEEPRLLGVAPGHGARRSRSRGMS